MSGHGRIRGDTKQTCPLNDFQFFLRGHGARLGLSFADQTLAAKIFDGLSTESNIDDHSNKADAKGKCCR